MSNFINILKRNGLLAVAAALLLPGFARADIALLVEEAIGGSGEFTGSGHSAVYFSNVCPDGPTKLRLCKAGEDGAVIAAYPEWGPNAPFRWIAVSLTSFLYGVEQYKDIPLYANGKVRTLLRETYRKNHLRSIAPDTADGSQAPGRWNQMIGSAFNRDVYALTVATTPEQDAQLIASLNGAPNVQDFQTTWSNCSDFARDVINSIFPNAAHRDFVNDLSMTTPKAIAKTFTHYATSRPELLFNISKYSQVAGPIRRSISVRHFTQKALTSKKYFLTMLFTKPEVMGGFLVPYLTTGIFDLDKHYVKYANEEIADLNMERAALKNSKTPARPQYASLKITLVDEDLHNPRVRLKAIDADKDIERRRLLGTPEIWANYQKEFGPMLSKAVETGFFRDKVEAEKFMKDLELQSKAEFDANGQLMLRVDDHGVERQLGITRMNILSSYSDPVLAYKLMLIKINSDLTASDKNRNSLPTFQSDWDLLKKLEPVAYAKMKDGRSYEARFRQNQEVVTGKKQFQKFMMTITH